MMTKGETMAEIMRLNPSVGATFLSEFSNEQLVRYLRRLHDLREQPMRSAARYLQLACSDNTRKAALQPA
jgi:hypothetical protein